MLARNSILRPRDDNQLDKCILTKQHPGYVREIGTFLWPTVYTTFVLLAVCPVHHYSCHRHIIIIIVVTVWTPCCLLLSLYFLICVASTKQTMMMKMMMMVVVVMTAAMIYRRKKKFFHKWSTIGGIVL